MYIKGHVKTVDTKDQSNTIVYCVCYVVCQHKCNALNAIFIDTVDTVDTGVCGFYTTLYTE